MNITRQDAWTKDEDVILAETVLQYIREEKTQLEAFKEVATQLSRTSAACGFRWNATIRKQYYNAIQLAKDERKENSQNRAWDDERPKIKQEQDAIDRAISLLKKLKFNSTEQAGLTKEELEHAVLLLEKENKRLKKQLVRYDDAWGEMKNLWQWIKQTKTE